MERPIPAYKGDDPYIFVSYAHEDADLIYPEIQWLHDQGFNIWYDEGINPGSTWRDEVALALTQCKVFLYYITPRSVASTNCLNEVNFCLSRERKMLSVHLEQTELPVGLELSLSAMQAIIRADHAAPAYQTKLADSLKSLLPNTIEPIAIAGIQTTQTNIDEKSIAILPLVNRNLDSENEYLCDGISEELIGGLSRVDGLRVTSAFAFKNQNLDISEVGKRKATETVLSGSIQKSGNRIRISLRLDRVDDGSALWSERYDRELDDIFELQEDVARQVIDALRVELGTDQKVQLINVGTQNVQAYNVFLLGLHEFRKNTRQSFEQAIIHFQQAALLDPGFGRAFWALYRCYSFLIGMIGLSRKELAPKAQEALNSAKTLGFVPPYPWVEAQRILYPETRPDQRSLAIEACEKIRQADPEWQWFEYAQLGNCLTAVGLFHAALGYHEFYLKHSPDPDAGLRSTYMRLLSHLGRFDRAIELWTEVINSEPDNQLAIGERALIYSRTGQYEKAERDLAELAKALPRNFAQFYHLYWRRELDAAKADFSWLESRRNLPLVYKYWGCFLLGDIEGGLNYMEEQVNRGLPLDFLRLQVVRVLPHSISREVEQHPRFQAILKQHGIDGTWRDELIKMANDLTDVTGIHVHLDEDY